MLMFYLERYRRVRIDNVKYVSPVSIILDIVCMIAQCHLGVYESVLTVKKRMPEGNAYIRLG